MNRKSPLLLATLGIFLSAGIASADEQRSEVQTEQRKTRIDGETGQVDQQRSEHKDVHAASPSGLSAEHSRENSASVQSPGGAKTEVKEKDKASANVKAEPDGAISVEQQNEHSEKSSTR